MAEDQEKQLQKRVCRACNEAYSYPVPRSTATRFHCEACADLPPAVRALFEKYNRRVKSLLAQIEKLERRWVELAGDKKTCDEQTK